MRHLFALLALSAVPDHREWPHNQGRPLRSTFRMPTPRFYGWRADRYGRSTPRTAEDHRMLARAAAKRARKQARWDELHGEVTP